MFCLETPPRRYGNGVALGFHSPSLGVLLDAGVNLVAHEARDEFADFGIVEKAYDLPAVAVHAANYDLFELAVEDVSEVVDSVGLACIAHGFVSSGIGADLVPEELIGDGESEATP